MVGYYSCSVTGNIYGAAFQINEYHYCFKSFHNINLFLCRDETLQKQGINCVVYLWQIIFLLNLCLDPAVYVVDKVLMYVI